MGFNAFVKFREPICEGRLVRRYKRFLADVELTTGEVVTAHCPNTGGMLGCQEPGSRVWLRFAPHPKRKLDYSWEMVECDRGALVGIYSARANALFREAWEQGLLTPFSRYEQLHSEVAVGDSRLDFLFQAKESGEQCYVEVKSVTASTEAGVALFPDAKTARGVKHLKELVALRQQGYRVALFFCVQRGDVHAVRPAPEFDADYSRNFIAALESGVEVYAGRCALSPDGIAIDQLIEVRSS